MSKGEFSVRFLARDLTARGIAPNLTYTVERYSKTVKGGPKECLITAYGSELDLWELANRLRQPISVFDGMNRWVWGGYLHEVTIRIGRIHITISIENMFNDVAVAYTNFGSRFTTSFTPLEESVDEYGTKQLLRSLSDATEQQAQNMVSTILSLQGYPHARHEITGQAEGGYSAAMICRGWFETLDWQYYTQPKGLVTNTSGGTGIRKMGVTYEKNTISFIAPDTIQDTASGLQAFQKNDVIAVASTTSNDGEYLVKEGTSTGFEIKVDGSISNESAGTTFGIFNATWVRESFKQVSGSSWDASSIHLRSQVVGSPTDDIVAGIWTNVSGSPGAELGSGSLAASNMDTTLLWREIPLSTCVALTDDTFYWIAVRRSASDPSGSTYYRVDVDEDQGYENGSFTIYNGSTWHTGTVDSDMLFRVAGTQETTSQIDEMVTAVGEFIRDVDIATQSGIETNQYREGETTALDEMLDFIRTGTNASVQLMIDITLDRTMVVDAEPTYSVIDTHLINSDGEVTTLVGTPFEKELCPVGIWIRLVDITPGNVNEALISNPTTIFVEEAEYWPQSNTYIPRPRATDSPWQIGMVQEG